MKITPKTSPPPEFQTPKKIAVASIATLFAASSAQATIIYITDSGFVVGDGASSAENWDIDSANANGHELRIKTDYSTSSGTYWIDMRSFANGFGVKSDGSFNLLNLGLSALVSGTMNFKVPNLGAVLEDGVFKNANGFATGASGYIGFQFDPTTSQVLYGWAEVILTENGSGYGTFEVVRWAYEDSGASILTGQTTAVPEPATAAAGLGLLALGAAGLRRWRKQKRAA